MTRYKMVIGLMSLNEPGFARIAHWLVDCGFVAVLKPTDLKVLLVIHRHAHYTTRNCRPTDQTIAKEGGIHPASVPLARKHLQFFRVIKAWMHRGRWHYSVPNDIGREFHGVYPGGGARKNKNRRNPGAYRRCRHCGRFESVQEHSRHACRKRSGQALREKPGTKYRQTNREITAGSATASAGASASPATHDEPTTKPLHWREDTLKLLDGKPQV